MRRTSFVAFPPEELGGVIVVNIFAILSTFALVSVALRATWLFIRRHPSLTAPQKREHVFFFNTHFGRYGACLLLAMTLQTTSGIIGFFWLAQRGITEGWLCRFQATLMQIATWGAAYFTVAIALHAFCSLVLGLRQSVIHCRPTMIVGWIIAISVGLIPFMLGHPRGPVYGADGLSCAVRSQYREIQFFLHLLPIFISSLLSAILYSLIFLTLRGTMKIRGGIKFTLNPEVRWKNSEEDYPLARVARSMLWYPVAYIALLVPYSLVRLLKISNFHVSFEVFVLAYVCWFILCVVIIFLLHNTFRILDSVMYPPSLSRGLQNFKYSNSHVSSTSWNEKITPDHLSSQIGFSETSSESFVLDPSPSRQDQSLTAPLSSPAFDYNHIITPPPSALLSSHSNMGWHDPENAPPLAAGIPTLSRQSRFATALSIPGQSLGNSVSNNDHLIIRPQSMQTIGRDNSSRSRVTSWSR